MNYNYGDELLHSQFSVSSSPVFGASFPVGHVFTDFQQSLDGRRILPRHWPNAINVRAGDRIDGIQLSYGPYRGSFHGSRLGGQLQRLKLFKGDRIIRVKGRAGQGPGAGIDQLTFFTLNGRVLGPFGGDGGQVFEVLPPSQDCFLGWISGRADLRLDAIQFHWRCPSKNVRKFDNYQDPLYNGDAWPYRDEYYGNGATKYSSLQFFTFGLIFLVFKGF